MIVNKPRFPRLAGGEGGEDDEIVLRFRKLRKKHPAPEYNRHRDGSWNPGDYLPTWLMKQTTEQLRYLCKRHALNRHGSRWRLVKRMYLHWRASRLQICGKGFEYFGYGVGYENVRDPECSCGSLRKKDWERIQKRKEEQKIAAREQLAKFLEPVMRFPRLPDEDES